MRSPVVILARPPADEVQGRPSPVFTVQWLGVSIVSPGVLGTEGHWDRTSFCRDNQRYYVCTTTRGQSTLHERTGVTVIKNEEVCLISPASRIINKLFVRVFFGFPHGKQGRSSCSSIFRIGKDETDI